MDVQRIPSHLDYPQSKAPRTEGIHLSNIIRGMAIETGILEVDTADALGLVEVTGSGETWWANLSKEKGEDAAKATRLRICLGLAWEQWYLPQLGMSMGVIDHPGEMCLDGVYMTHDGESIDMLLSKGGIWVQAIHEVKLSFKSTRTVGEWGDPEKWKEQWMWKAQTMGYCKALGTRVAYILVLFVCGDYKLRYRYQSAPAIWDVEPQLIIWRVEYTQAEIDNNWDLALEYVAANRGY